MKKSAGKVVGFEGSWYLVTPALPAPRKITLLDWYGPPTEILRAWDQTTSEAVQSAQIGQLWNAMCGWCEQAKVDEVEIEGAEHLGKNALLAMGFRARPIFRFRHLPLGWIVHWYFSGTPFATASVLRKLIEHGGFSLVARSNGVDRLRLRDNSWDGMYLNIAGEDSPSELARLTATLESVRASTIS
jgi:hypothetical protein